MNRMGGLFRRKKSIVLPTSRELNTRIDQLPDNIVERCPACNRLILQAQLGETYVCTHCNYHLKFPTRERAKWITHDRFEELFQDIPMDYSLDFPGYEEKHQATQAKTGLDEAVLTGRGVIGEEPVALGIMASEFFMGSMGRLVGEKLTRLFDYATEERLPVVLYVASGGARMQESIISLMQMAKVTQAVTRHSDAGLFYLSILTNPTTGGVTASFAMQGDIIVAEPKATIGFAGRRVIEQTINRKLPDDFQTAEIVLKNGFIDKIISRQDQLTQIPILIKANQPAEQE